MCAESIAFAVASPSAPWRNSSCSSVAGAPARRTSITSRARFCFGTAVVSVIRLRVRRAGMTGATTLMVNYLGDVGLEAPSYFGGAMVVSQKGEVMNSLPVGQEGILVADI